MADWEKSTLSRGNSRNQWPKVGPCLALALWRSRNISVAGAEGWTGEALWWGCLTPGALQNIASTMVSIWTKCGVIARFWAEKWQNLTYDMFQRYLAVVLRTVDDGWTRESSLEIRIQFRDHVRWVPVYCSKNSEKLLDSSDDLKIHRVSSQTAHGE